MEERRGEIEIFKGYVNIFVLLKDKVIYFIGDIKVLSFCWVKGRLELRREWEIEGGVEWEVKWGGEWVGLRGSRGIGRGIVFVKEGGLRARGWWWIDEGST